MGYIIVSRLTPQGDRRYVAWMEDNQPIMQEMARWLDTGECLEILDYVPGGKSTLNNGAPLYDPTTRIHRWHDVFMKQEQTNGI
jgi:hypothetical protein